jgi:type I restriction enzyme S subunit
MSRKDEIESRAGGTTYKEINKSTFRAMRITWPDGALVEAFAGFARDVMRQVRTLKRQSEKLRQARDLLLPRLMSGELAV